MKKRVVAAAAATVVVAIGAGSASAADYIYWLTNSGQTGTIGRAALDGSDANQSFISGLGQMAIGLDVDASNLYWTSGTSPRALGKAALDGSGLNNNLATIANNMFSGAVAVSGSYAYTLAGATAPLWANLARVGTDGSGFNSGFITSVFGQGAVNNVATDGTYLYMGQSGTQIARANIDGTGLNSSLITTQSVPGDIAAAGGYVYWVQGSNSIWRAKNDGTDAASLISGLSNVNGGLAVNSQYIYWAQNGGCSTGTYCISRANIDGTGVTSSLITGLPANAGAIAVTAASVPTPTSAPTPAPAPAPTPTPAASTLKTPTVNTSTPGQNAVVTVAVQLAQKGKYTFIFERPSANEMSREQATSSRVAMQKGTRIGKRRLAKAYTAAVVTTTEDNAKLVTRALLRKAQAKKLNLRVVHTATSGAQTASVIKIK